MKPLILVCTDFSECSERALRRAAEVAVHDNARVLLLNVYGASRDQANRERPWDEHSMRKLKETRSKYFRELSDNDVQYESVPSTHVANTIRRVANEHHASLIVLGSHGRTGVVRQLLGSVAENVVRHARCSVLVVRDDPDKA